MWNTRAVNVLSRGVGQNSECGTPEQSTFLSCGVGQNLECGTLEQSTFLSRGGRSEYCKCGTPEQATFLSRGVGQNSECRSAYFDNGQEFCHSDFGCRSVHSNFCNSLSNFCNSLSRPEHSSNTKLPYILLACSALQDLRMSLAAEFCTCWSGLMADCR